MRSSVMYMSKFRMVDMILRRFIMIPWEVFLRYHLRNTRSIYLLVSGRSIVDGLWDAL